MVYFHLLNVDNICTFYSETVNIRQRNALLGSISIRPLVTRKLHVLWGAIKHIMCINSSFQEDFFLGLTNYVLCFKLKKKIQRHENL